MEDFSDRLKKSEFIVSSVDKKTAQELVEKYHYAKGMSCVSVYLHGLFRKTEPDKCLGIALWIPPTKSAALATFPENWQAVLALSRLVIVPGVPKNAATFLMSQSRKMIDNKKWKCLVTYADDWQGHTGTIYKADNWNFVGKTKPETTFVKDGRMIARKNGSYTRTHKEMLEIGCEILGKFSKSKYVRFT